MMREMPKSLETTKMLWNDDVHDMILVTDSLSFVLVMTTFYERRSKVMMAVVVVTCFFYRPFVLIDE